MQSTAAPWNANEIKKSKIRRSRGARSTSESTLVFTTEHSKLPTHSFPFLVQESRERTFVQDFKVVLAFLAFLAGVLIFSCPRASASGHDRFSLRFTVRPLKVSSMHRLKLGGPIRERHQHDNDINSINNITQHIIYTRTYLHFRLALLVTLQMVRLGFLPKVPTEPVTGSHHLLHHHTYICFTF